jgi:parvulin-like peptidyl-prolyl isomerase
MKFAALLLLALPALGRADAVALAPSAAQALSPEAQAPSAPGPGAEVYQKIAAKVGTEIITSFDVDEGVKMVEASMSPSEAMSDEGKKKLAEARKNVLDQMIEEKLVVLAAEKGPEGYKDAADKGTAPANPYLPANLEIEEELDKAFDQARNRFSSQEDFEAELKKERISLSEFRSRLRERLRSQMTFARMVKAKEQEYRPSLRVSDDESLAYYNDHKSDFAVGAQIELRQILYSPSEESRARAAASALKLSPHLLQDFSARAKKDSRDELSADKGGMLGWIEKGGLRWPEVDDAAFKLKKGEMAGPIKSDDGLHLIYVEDTKEGEQKSFDDVKNQVRNAVYQQKVQKRIEDWVEDLKREFFVEREDG